MSKIFIPIVPASRNDHAAKPAPLPSLHLPPLGDGNQYRFHTIIKPSGAQCNLACTYCFYLHKEELLDQPRNPRMSDDMLVLHIRQYIEAQTGPEIVFTWQGGEPTLMGLPFYRRVVELQQRFAKPGQRILNDLQTNGILLNDEWAAFLKAHDFLVGISIDGPAELHDRYRTKIGGKPTFNEVMRAITLLHRHGVPFNALCVVNRTNARRPIDVYRFLRDEVRPRVIQFLPCVETTAFSSVAPGKWQDASLPTTGSAQARPGASDSVVTEWSVDPEDWGYFLTRVWDEWFKRDYGQVHVDQFENVISQLLGFGAQTCVSNEFCGKSLAIEHNGDVYACDHFAYPEYKLGNIRKTHQGDMAFSSAQQQFGFAKRDTLPAYCRSCRHLELCWGECPRNRFVKTPDGEPGLNYLCPGLKAFYARAKTAEAELRKRVGGSQ